MPVEGVIVVILAVSAPSTVDAGLDFRRNANERPSKRGPNQKQNKYRGPYIK